MANVLIDNTKLTALGNAIRAKTGKSDLMTVSQMATEVASITGTEGGDDDIVKIANRTLTSVVSNFTTYKHARLFQYCPLESASFPEWIDGNGTYICADCTHLQHIDVPKLEEMGMCDFQNCSALEIVVLPSLQRYTANNNFDGCTSLEIIDYGAETINEIYFLSQNEHKNNTVLTTVIIRATNVVATLGNLNNFTGTPFAEGGTGGTLYVPQALISSYQSATNWSTILGYENNSIVAIEGSIYETRYADGTPIASS